MECIVKNAEVANEGNERIKIEFSKQSGIKYFNTVCT